MRIYIYSDGASRNNPGRSASGYALYDKFQRCLFSHAFYNGIRTNNEAEYLAIIAAMKKADELYGYVNDIVAFTDSELMARQISGQYRTKDSGLRPLNVKARELARGFMSFTIKSVPRENRYISLVDAELNSLLDRLDSGHET